MISTNQASNNEKVTIQARKYNNKLHYEWQAKVLQQTAEYVLVYCEAGRQFIHHTKQATFTMPFPSLEWFYFDRGYTVAISLKPEGEMYYCNIAQPATFTDGIVSFTDLDIDYLKEVGGEWEVVDVDEFEHHRQLMSYSDEIITFAHISLAQLKFTVEQGSYPFSLRSADLQKLVNNLLLEK